MMTAMASLQAQIFDMLQHSQYWPVAKLRAYQESQLAQLIAHARKEVPFYEGRLDILFDHSGAIDWSRWPEVPVLTRAELRDHGKEICARRLPQGHGVVRDAATSGSTGVPVCLRQNDLYKQSTLTAGSRFAQWAGVLPDMTFASLAPHFPDHLPPDVNVHTLPIRDPAIRGSGRRLLLRRTLPAPALLDVIAAEGVQALGGNVVLLEILARVNLKRARPLRFSAVMFFGVEVDPAQRRIIGESFGARCTDTYSSEETGRIAGQCEHGSYHINAEQMLVEIVGKDNRPVQPGQEGRVLVTPFLLTSQPLIRYEIGDLAVAGNACSCGRTLPTIDRLTGRQFPLFLGPDGTRIPPLFDHEAIVATLDCKAYQIAQTTPLALELRYIPDGEVSKAAFDHLRTLIRAVMPAGTSVVFREVDSLPDPTGRKIQRLVREFQIP